jgi:hypothetical protein
MHFSQLPNPFLSAEPRSTHSFEHFLRPTTADMATWTQVCIPIPTAKGIEEWIDHIHNFS